MPEEINRLLTDQISDLLFTPSDDGNRNLAREGISADKIHLVGNVMIDTLVRMLPAARAAAKPELPEKYTLVTLHRPSNVDDLDWLEGMLSSLEEIGRQMPVVFPVHPRTRQRLAQRGGRVFGNGLMLLDPLPYVSFLGLQIGAAVVITDSGGIQEETTFLGVPCLTVRENTERPITVEVGTNILVGRDTGRLRREVEKILAGDRKKGGTPAFWDGHAAERIAQIIAGRA
jgi:UDP-N-acetylglucosamine 2-epimerase (non-hydrolysing)